MPSFLCIKRAHAFIPWIWRDCSLCGPVLWCAGHYGLVLVGDANVQGCNASHWCCDTYNATHSHTSCAGGYMCSGTQPSQHRRRP